MSSKAAAYFREALTNPSEAPGPAQVASEIPSALPDTMQTFRRFLIKGCVNLHSPTDKLLVNPARNQRRSANIPDYNVAYIRRKTILTSLVDKSALLPGAVI
jgi:hypothetical protein